MDVSAVNSCALVQNSGNKLYGQGRKWRSPCSGLLSVPCLHVLSYRFSTVLPGVSLQVVFRRFLLSPQICQSTCCVAGRVMYVVVACVFCSFLLIVSLSCPRCSYDTMFMAGRVCFWWVFKKKRSSPTTSLNTTEFDGSRLGQLDVSVIRTHHNSVWRLQIRTCAPRRNTRTVRFDGCPMFSWTLTSCLRTCRESDNDCSFFI